MNIKVKANKKTWIITKYENALQNLAKDLVSRGFCPVVYYGTAANGRVGMFYKSIKSDDYVLAGCI